MRLGYPRVFIGLVAWTICAQAQWLNQPDPKAPRTKDGKPNLTAPAPRLRGKPDLSGIWQAESTPRAELVSLFPRGLLPGGENGLGEDDPQKYFLNVLADYKFGQEPFTPAAGARFGQMMKSGEKPPTLCPPPSLPIYELIPQPFKIVQGDRLTLMLFEADTRYRQIYTDGRKHPVDPQPSWMGYSIGRWEGDTFVVEAMGFNDKGVLDAMGHFHGEDLRITERLRRRDFGHIETQFTLEDPKTFTKPITFQVNLRLLPDTDLIESFCSEAESDLKHMPGK